MENNFTYDEDYCPKCGLPLLYPEKPCPGCVSNSDKTNNDLFKNSIYFKEPIYFYISLVLSILLYLIFTITVIPLIYFLFIGFLVFLNHGLMIGHIRGNAVKASENQFPEVYKIAQNLSFKIGLKKCPDIYVLQQGGVLNAFATRFLSRNFAIFYSDILELAYQEGESTLEFIICHELTHLKRSHIQKRLWLLPAMCVPFLNTAYSRACEYTCDKVSATYTGRSNAEKGLILLAAGKKLYNKVNILDYINQARSESGFWSWLSEIFSTHPHLYKRIEEVMKTT